MRDSYRVTPALLDHVCSLPHIEAAARRRPGGHPHQVHLLRDGAPPMAQAALRVDGLDACPAVLEAVVRRSARVACGGTAWPGACQLRRAIGVSASSGRRRERGEERGVGYVRSGRRHGSARQPTGGEASWRRSQAACRSDSTASRDSCGRSRGLASSRRMPPEVVVLGSCSAWSSRSLSSSLCT